MPLSGSSVCSFDYGVVLEGRARGCAGGRWRCKRNIRRRAVGQNGSQDHGC